MLRNKEKILGFFLENQGVLISGEKIGKALGISRNNVYVNVKELIKEGYKINVVRNKGYLLESLKEDVDLAQLFKEFKGSDMEIEVLDEVESTNQYLKKLLLDKNYASGKLVIAKGQKKGRGRMGRSFYSPHNKGIYLSLYLGKKKDIPINNFLSLTIVASVVRTLEEIFKLDFKIKWINDIYYNEKKVCGILTEGTLNIEGGSIENLVIGIGINTDLSPKYPGEIEDVYGVLPSIINKNKVISKVVKNLCLDLEDTSIKRIIDFYNERLMYKNEDVIVYKNKEPLESVRLLKVGYDGSLIVEDKLGAMKKIMNEEISIKK